MNRFEPVDIVALMLASCICLMLVLVPILLAATGRELSAEKSELGADVVNAAVAIVSIYVGAKLNTIGRR